MAGQKSKLPDVSEITSMASKLFHDIKNSISQIITGYKAKHDVPVKEATATTKEKTTPKAKAASKTAKPAAKKTAVKAAAKPKASKPKVSKPKAGKTVSQATSDK